MRIDNYLKIVGLVSLATQMIQCGYYKDAKEFKKHEHIGSEFKNIGKNSDQTIYVHLLAHTHDDVGWLKTVDEYYSGTQVNVAYADVEMILDTVVFELLQDPTKKFTYVEMKFFSMWWKNQTDDIKNKVRMLVQQGRLEIVNAGWSMHDEACINYEDMMNNMMKGHEFLLNEIGVKPRIGWHVDPFGHSNANPRLFAEMGFDAWFFGRLDYQDQEVRMKEKSMEFIWRPMFDHLGLSTQIFTHAMQDMYCAPDFLEIDERSHAGEAIVIDPSLETFNADQIVQDMVNYVNDAIQHYQGNHIMLPLGCDFAYSNAKLYFRNTDRLIKYFNAKVQNIQLVYSTPGSYLDAKKSDNLIFPVKYDDMFPYAGNEDDYWTGYFTSRPNSKKQIKDFSGNFHAFTKLTTMKVLDQSVSNDTVNQILNAKQYMLDQLGINQHHDAVTGTARQHVADDYKQRIYKATQLGNQIQTQILQEQIESLTNIKSSEWSWCNRTNGTYLDCPIFKYGNQKHIVAVYNPATIDQSFVKLKVQYSTYRVFYWSFEQNKFIDISSSQAEVICAGRLADQGDYVQDCELHVSIRTPSLSFNILQLVFDSQIDLNVKADSGNTHKISGYQELLVFEKYDPDNGALFDLLKIQSGKQYKIGFDMRVYNSDPGDKKNSASGAYIFKPDRSNQDSVTYCPMTDIKSFTGKFTSEIQMIFQNQDQSRQVLVRVRYYDVSPVSEWDVVLYGLPDKDSQGLEVTVNFKSMDIDNQNTFYTDSNGLEMQKRILNYRPTWNITAAMKVSSNYYPINSAISIVDEKQKLQMTVMNDRSQGGSVLQKGRIELMQNRRLYHDDDRGLSEHLNETDSNGKGIIVPATYRLQFLERANDFSYQRTEQIVIDEPLELFFTNKVDFPKSSKQSKQSGIDKILYQLDLNLPQTLKVIPFPLQRNQILLRVENIGDKFDTDYRSLSIDDTSITFDILDFAVRLFNASNKNPIKLNYLDVKELALSGNQLLKDMVKTKTDWNTTAPGDKDRQPKIPKDISDTKIVLSQQRIRLFNITYVIAQQHHSQNQNLHLLKDQKESQFLS
ncbi:glycosyl hydrolases family 38 protein [Stylonychia lemnae]|uniref:Glycosyl hydrolases family 38 protein n=1 Tax=Stylonychia lemnae TaxID=5949 RepID=A0A077ZWX6_STYLE|nr:glycosyl hydrolases family 38 protein [Stylonychia lemnae]|eukprot:CDW74355.1 glycosyl hydrolases family 38 protein [Stylonychia lemnae]